jgi:hypothetical protein
MFLSIRDSSSYLLTDYGKKWEENEDPLDEINSYVDSENIGVYDERK